MKLAALSLLLSAAVAFAEPTVTMETSSEKEPGHTPLETGCWVDHYEKTSFKPVIDGLEAPAKLRIYAVVEAVPRYAGKDDRKKMSDPEVRKNYRILVGEKNVKPGGKPRAVAGKVVIWGCKCCGRETPISPKIVGWTAELEDAEGKIIAEAKSSPEADGEIVATIMRVSKS
ncbi:MAG: hypothetical protein IAE94_01845 [Chthoniobacterales bacterium]|nr:hypothetical protein [Chthoniobacterales bacterium]